MGAREMVQGALEKLQVLSSTGGQGWGRNLMDLSPAWNKDVAPLSSPACLLSQRTPLPFSQSGLWEAGNVFTMSLKGETEHLEG